MGMAGLRARHYSLMAALTLAMVQPLGARAEPAENAAADTILFDVGYVGDIWNSVRGGIKTGTRYLDNIDLLLTIDGKAIGLDNATFFFYGLYNNSTTLSDVLVGDAQTISNIDAERHFRLEEAWFEQRSADDRASIKAGLIDLNSEFDVKDTGALFINSSHGIGPDFSQTGRNGPSIFPSTSLAVRAMWQFPGPLRIKFGAFDAVPNNPHDQRKMKFSWNQGTLFVAELDGTGKAGLRAAIGVWTYTSKFAPILPAGGARVGGNNGAYAFVEGPLSAHTRNLGEGLDGFVRIGFADGRINQFRSFWSAGITYAGPIPGREGDQAGLAIAHAVNGSAFKQSLRLASGAPTAFETDIEVTYRLQVFDWLALQPDIQYVLNPGAEGRLADALVFGLRFEIGASF